MPSDEALHLRNNIEKEKNMNTKFEPLFQSYTLNNGVVVRSRLAIAPLTHWSSDANGHVTPEELAYYKARSHGFGLFISPAIAVCKEGIGFTGQPAAFGEQDLESLIKMAKAMKSNGALVIAQLQHSGAAALTNLNGGIAYAPSSLDEEITTISGKQTVHTQALTEEEIQKVIQDFVGAAELAIRAGFDGIELH